MSRRGTAEEKTAKSDPIYRNRNMESVQLEQEEFDFIVKSLSLARIPGENKKICLGYIPGMLERQRVLYKDKIHFLDEHIGNRNFIREERRLKR